VTGPRQTAAPVDQSWTDRWFVRLFTRRRGRPLGGLFLAALLALSLLPDFAPALGLRMALFDAYQKAFPRTPQSSPAVIVAIDEKSLAELGQWPWPRTILAELIRRLSDDNPAAIGIDVLFPEADRMSPASIASIVEATDAALARRLAALPGNDAVFAEAIARSPVVLGIAGLEEQSPTAGRTAPFLVRGDDPRRWVRGFQSASRSIPVIDQAASGHALLSVDTHDGIVRRIPLVASVAGTLTPALSIEMLRVASGRPAFGMNVDSAGVASVSVGNLRIPTEPDGSVWIRFGHRDANRFVSAADVIAGRLPADIFEQRLVLIGATGLGLLDHQATPLGERMPGIEIHAQILENIFDGELLSRPALVRHGERLLLLACGLILIAMIPALRPRTGAILYAGLLALCAATGIGLFLTQHVLFDVAWPALGTTLVFGALLGGTLADSDRQRRALARQLDLEREAAALAAGELEAARRIQLGMLPPTSGAFYRDSRFDLEAMLETAKLVGGDLYDYFKLDQDRLFFLIGDVSGKGLPASIFMAVSKALYKSAALRSGGDIGLVMRSAQQEIARDNPEALFVTVFAAMLDLSTGQMEFCNAGHEPPLSRIPGRDGLETIRSPGGPPLCVLDDFPYASDTYTLSPGEALCIVTDGVTEAMDTEGRLYGRDRLASVFARHALNASAARLVEAIKEDLDQHSAGAERSDDITILVLKWNG
jgi:adenylate cyclase